MSFYVSHTIIEIAVSSSRNVLCQQITNISKYLFLTKETLHKLKLKNYNVMIKIDKQDLIDIIDIKNTGLSDKNGVKNMSYVFSTNVR